MCFSIPKKIAKINSKEIIVKSFEGEEEKISTSLVRIKRGDWILSQNNIIVKKITAKQAKEINSLISVV